LGVKACGVKHSGVERRLSYLEVKPLPV